MWNTSLPLPALLAWPVTATAGVLASHTLLAVLAFAGSATSMWWVAGRFAQWPWARFAAGLLYGFSPYLVAQGTGHLNLSLVALPPLVLLLAHELLVRQRRRAAVAGLLLGLVAFAQMMTTLEVLASTFVVAVAGTVVLVLQHRSAVRERFRHAAVGLGTAAGVLTVLAAWPLSVLFTGPRAVLEPVQDRSPYAADLLGTVVPTITRCWARRDAHGGRQRQRERLLPRAAAVAVLALLAWRFRGVAVVRFAASWASSHGCSRWASGCTSRAARPGVPLPYALVAQLPVLHNMAAVRFSLYVVLCAALVLAVGLDPAATAEGVLRPALAVRSPFCACCRWCRTGPYEHERARIPAYFTGDAVERVPEDALALTFPVPRFPDSAPMLWQVAAGYRYRSVGGYVITPEEDGSGTFRGGVTAWERVVGQAPSGRLGEVAPQVRAALLLEMEQLGAQAVLVADRPGADAVVRVVTGVLGRGPDEATGGVTAWYDLDPRARRVELGLVAG
jgi:hypothetical protein